eukprot:TRINITY_DN11229_c0_g1_i1.p1 TRINITY_DN11229_c0_g1~~TRINITY_DN11229_c0_g1_i1.p1  ORF type:complete len:135 (+),score=3.81 TRINITY_DN11229_c0_g1_i1:576-980(+)
MQCWVLSSSCIHARCRALLSCLQPLSTFFMMTIAVIASGPSCTAIWPGALGYDDPVPSRGCQMGCSKPVVNCADTAHDVLTDAQLLFLTVQERLYHLCIAQHSCCNLPPIAMLSLWPGICCYCLAYNHPFCVSL